METPTCIICNGSGAKFCSSCHSISYCSLECQKTDWPLHKTICKTFTTLPSRPSPSHKLAILFPVHSKHPQLIWIKCERHVDDGVEWELPDSDELLEAENLHPRFKNLREYNSIPRNALRGFDLSYTIKLIFRDGFFNDGSSPNLCIRQATRGQAKHDWRGPMLALRQPGTDMDPLFYEDIRAGDLRVATDYFITYGRGP